MMPTARSRCPNGVKTRIGGEFCGERIMRRHGNRRAMHVNLGA
jgi:hypothetical protein